MYRSYVLAKNNSVMTITISYMAKYYGLLSKKYEVTLAKSNELYYWRMFWIL